ncbi:MAG: ATP-dependent DNA helicase RecG [Eubacteriales bacterium]|nr:ATP-dependent DNA helicase RecG [Eubacteriales bacterium]
MMELRDIKGIGAKRLALLASLGIKSFEDALSYYPSDYIDGTNIVPVCQLNDGQRASVSIEVISNPSVFYKGKMSIVTVRCADETGKLTLRWYNQPYRGSQLHIGDRIAVIGKVTKDKSAAMINPIMSVSAGCITPVYSTCKGLTQNIIKDVVAVALGAHKVYETLPAEILRQYGLMGRDEATRQLHIPKSTELLKKAQERMSFEHTLMYMLVVEQRKDDRRAHSGLSFNTDGLMDKFLKRIPFAPTKAQMQTMAEVDCDMSSSVPMNRLIQGDVGSGKTLIAEYALTVAAANGYQGAFMAPTEILARQHYQTLSRLFGCTCGLLLGSQTATERRAVLERIRTGECFVAVGTHALLNDTVVFDRLGVVITDEQHRFGVAQRAKLSHKGLRPDTLVMSATPIPRTLALILYGDLDLSVIDELPPNRKSIKTRFIAPHKREDLYKYIETEAQHGNQSYVVCPMIEADEQLGAVSAEELYVQLKKQYGRVKVGLIHGRMTEKDKNAVMEQFKDGQIGVLVSTTVIEVGIDVENATNIVIENAERFGLATLHQLRGRVGRGEKQSYCFLLSNTDDVMKSERIKAMLDTCDGFEIAQRDMEQRGTGDILGLRQHGERSSNSIGANCTLETLQNAVEAAKNILSTPTAVNHDLLIRSAEYFSNLDSIANN